MTRTTIILPEAIKSMALSAARRRNMNFSEFVRAAIVETAGKGRAVSKESLIAKPLVYKGPAERDLGRNHDKYLYDEPAARKTRKRKVDA
ncbi:MAG: hypothetical protein NTW19_01690 [Planctomycetota bacterium]|nr:hypothetical protein [Planctomycetota bacterium]